MASEHQIQIKLIKHRDLFFNKSIFGPNYWLDGMYLKIINLVLNGLRFLNKISVISNQSFQSARFSRKIIKKLHENWVKTMWNRKTKAIVHIHLSEVLIKCNGCSWVREMFEFYSICDENQVNGKPKKSVWKRAIKLKRGRRAINYFRYNRIYSKRHCETIVEGIKKIWTWLLSTVTLHNTCILCWTNKEAIIWLERKRHSIQPEMKCILNLFLIVTHGKENLTIKNGIILERKIDISQKLSPIDRIILSWINEAFAKTHKHSQFLNVFTPIFYL